MPVGIWIGFLAFVSLMLALDLGVFHRKAHVISVREALGWTATWVSLALSFNVLVYFLYEHQWLDVVPTDGVGGAEAALQFFMGYVVEYSLSMDNIFVIAMIFQYFRVPSTSQHRVLFWGIIGAAVMRGVMILLGTALITRFEWIMYIFGVLLIITAIKMLVMQDEHIDPEKNFLVRWARRFYPVTTTYVENRFTVMMDGKRYLTPLFLALMVVETTDLLFAIDSIPAIFAITKDPFLVFTSNIFAILGLRSLYFALAGMMDKFRYLKLSLVFLLAYIGVKMLVSHYFHIPTLLSLAIIASILGVGIIASLIHAKEADEKIGKHS